MNTGADAIAYVVAIAVAIAYAIVTGPRQRAHVAAQGEAP